MLDLEHLANLHEFVVSKSVTHLMGRRLANRAKNRPQPPQVRGELLDWYALLAAQLTNSMPVRGR
jgi:hypothetical protein